MHPLVLSLLAPCLALAAAAGCGPYGNGSDCGPSVGTVTRVIDGDTVDLDSGERVRYLMIDTPECTGGKDDCYGRVARDYNATLVLDREVKISYDVQCTGDYDRLLAYVEVDGVEVNARMVEFGYACVLYYPPNGEDRRVEYTNLEAEARAAGRGMWGACEEVTCDK